MLTEEVFYELMQKVAMIEERLDQAVYQLNAERESRKDHLGTVECKLDSINAKLHQFLFGNGEGTGLTGRLHDLEVGEARRERGVRWLMGIVGGSLVALIGKIAYDALYLLPHLTQILKPPGGH